MTYIRSLIVAAISMAFLPAAPVVADESMMLINRYAAKEDGSVNTYIVDDGTTIVIVDGQRLNSRASDVVSMLDDRGDRVAVVLLTHPHPDHFGGLNLLRETVTVPVYASQATADEIAGDTRGYHRMTRELFPDDTSSFRPHIDRIVGDGETLDVGDFRFEVIELGPGEASTMTMFYEPSRRMLFAGDLFAVGMTPFLLEENVLPWIDQLDQVAAMFPGDMMVYPGHGRPGPLAELVPAQKAYLEDIVRLVSEARSDGRLKPMDVEAIVKEMDRLYPDHTPVAVIPDLKTFNVEAVDQELSHLD